MQMPMLEIVSLELARFWSKKILLPTLKISGQAFKVFCHIAILQQFFEALQLVVLSNDINAIFFSDQTPDTLVGFWEGGEKIFEHGFTNIAASWQQQHSKRLSSV